LKDLSDHLPPEVNEKMKNRRALMAQPFSNYNKKEAGFPSITKKPPHPFGREVFSMNYVVSI
jgi:hypothetical protein